MSKADKYDRSDERLKTYSNQAIGQTLKKIRKQRGMASSDVAFEADIHPSYYSMLENGKNCVSVKKLSGICQVHHLSLSDFFQVVEESRDSFDYFLEEKAKPLGQD